MSKHKLRTYTMSDKKEQTNVIICRAVSQLSCKRLNIGCEVSFIFAAMMSRNVRRPHCGPSREINVHRHGNKTS